jgi:hypothetical protein
VQWTYHCPRACGHVCADRSETAQWRLLEDMLLLTGTLHMNPHMNPHMDPHMGTLHMDPICNLDGLQAVHLPVQYVCDLAYLCLCCLQKIQTAIEQPVDILLKGDCIRPAQTDTRLLTSFLTTSCHQHW